MSGFFNIENPVFHVINKVVDMVGLSFIYSIACLPSVFMASLILSEGGNVILFYILFIIACIPIGPATTALYYAVVKVIRRERGYAFREFFRSFTKNFLQAMIVSLIIGTLVIVLYFDYRYVPEMKASENKTFSLIMTVVFNVVTIMTSLILVYIFPVLSRFDLKIKQLFKNSIMMAIRHLLSSVVMVVTVFAFAFITWLFIPIPVFMIAPGLACLLCSFLMERIFKKYMPVPEVPPEESGIDTWYLE